LAEAKGNLCKLVTLTGPTKSGKTVLARRVFPRDQVVWLDGGPINSEDLVWSEVNDQLNVATDTGSVTTAGSESTVGGQAGGEIGLGGLFAWRANAQAAEARQDSSSWSARPTSDPKTAAIAALRAAGKPLMIDDFHYLPRDVQGNVIRGLKSLVFDGLPVVLLAIPHRRYDAVRVEREITGRVENIQVPPWSPAELRGISEVGFPLLNMTVSADLQTTLADQALGSPHLMQEFCRELCGEVGVAQTADQRVTVGRHSLRDELFRRVAAATGRTMFDKLKRGPRQRADRIQRRLRNGSSTDIYGVVLVALASLQPGIETIQYEDLRTAIRNVCESSLPQAHEVSRVLEKMAEISAGEDASTPVIDWEKDERLLHITDPFFAYYLRWGDT
jgi:hypothetical protein